ncbi:MAG: SRPBCC domain-containing protein [Eubacteriales bacterium]
MDNQSNHTRKQELVMSRIFSVPRGKVWKAWTDPESAKEWWGPVNFTAPFIHIDLRVGGKYVNCMRSPDGTDYWSTGFYKEITPPSRLVLTDSFADENGNIVGADYYGMDPGFPRESLVTVTLEEIDGKTGFTMKYDDVSQMKDEDLQGMKQGWNESFDKLADYLSRQEQS